MAFSSLGKWRVLATLLLLPVAAPPAAAQQAPGRALAVPADAAWQHAETQMILPARAADMTRGEMRDLGDQEMDVVAQYRESGGETFATVYLFRTMTPYAALWFDRALTALTVRQEYGLQGAAPPVATFQRPGAANASGLWATVDVPAQGLRSTGVAIAPLGRHHLLKVRISSSRLDRAALQARLGEFIAALRWPAETAPAPAAVPIEPCPAPLNLRQARIVRQDGADVLMNLLLGTVAAEQEGPPPVYCREPLAPALAYGVYRPNAATDFYIVALNDAGIALSVGQGFSIEGGRRGRAPYAMKLLDRASTSVLPSFNRLPPPEQAIAVAFGNRGPTISVSTDGPRDR